MSTISKQLHQKLSDPEYRKAFVASQINFGIPYQLRALLKSRSKTQEWLAEKTGMLQPRISGLVNPGKTRPNIETLRRLAEAFDCGLAVRFVPFSEMAGWSHSFDPEKFIVPEFKDDPGFSPIEAQEQATAGSIAGNFAITDSPTNPILASTILAASNQQQSIQGAGEAGARSGQVISIREAQPRRKGMQPAHAMNQTFVAEKINARQANYRQA